MGLLRPLQHFCQDGFELRTFETCRFERLPIESGFVRFVAYYFFHTNKMHKSRLDKQSQKCMTNRVYSSQSRHLIFWLQAQGSLKDILNSVCSFELICKFWDKKLTYLLLYKTIPMEEFAEIIEEGHRCTN